MNVRIFGNSSASAARRRDLRPARAEPRLFVGGESRAPAAAAVDGPRSAVAESASGISMTSPQPISAPGDRLVTAVGGVGAGSALQVVLVGVVAAAIIGGFLGVGFLLLERPAEQTVAASRPGLAPAAAPISPPPAMPHPAPANLPAQAPATAPSVADRAPAQQAAAVSQTPSARAALPSSPLVKSPDHAAAPLASRPKPKIADATLTRAAGGQPEPPAAESDHRAHRPPAALADHRPHRAPSMLADRAAQPPPGAASDHRLQHLPATVSDHRWHRPPGALAGRGTQPPAAIPDRRAERAPVAVPDHRAERVATVASGPAAPHPLVHDRPFDRTRTAARHPHLQPRADDRPAPKQARTARLSPASPDGGTQSFDRLLSQLTDDAHRGVAQDGAARGQGARPMQPGQQRRSADQVLTPPSADQPDPFAGSSQRQPADAQ